MPAPRGWLEPWDPLNLEHKMTNFVLSALYNGCYIYYTVVNSIYRLDERIFGAVVARMQWILNVSFFFLSTLRPYSHRAQKHACLT